MKQSGPFVIFAASFFTFAVITLLVFRFPVLPPFDEAVHGFFSSIATPPWLAVNRAASFFGEGYVLYLAVFALACFFVLKKRIGLGILSVVSLVLGVHVNALFKVIFERERPHFIDTSIVLKSFAYPSGHAFGAVVFYVTAVIFLQKAGFIKGGRMVFLPVFFVVILVGSSRMALGVHWASDVFGGFCLGLCWVSIVLAVADKWRFFDRPPQ